MLITAIVVAVLVLTALYLFNRLFPAAPRVHLIVSVLVGLLLFLWLVDLFFGRHYFALLTR